MSLSEQSESAETKLTGSIDFKGYAKEQLTRVDAALDEYLPADDVHPATIHAAMRHSIFAGGKRLRPILVLAAADACGGQREGSMALACAVECLHTFTLIHDDLPCMDDDDFRRGKPTCHKVYGDAIAVLAGDALQAFAFELASFFPGAGPYRAGQACRELAIASGSVNVVAGQVLDLEAEGNTEITLDQLRTIHEKKTASLLATSLRFGGISAAASEEQLAALSIFGQQLGLAFQVIDDILDTTQSSEVLGKTAGKDEAMGKATYPSILGLEEARAEAKRLTVLAKESLGVFGEDAALLLAAADYLLDRDY